MNKRKRLLACLAAVSMLISPAAAVCAEEDAIEIVLTDVTGDDETTLAGEAKVKVSVKGAGGNVSAVQTALEFSGALQYKSISFLQGGNNPPKHFNISPNAALTNITGKMLPGIVTNAEGKMQFTDAQTDLFVITFKGTPGDSVTVRLNTESAAGTYCAVDDALITAADADVSLEAKASSKTNTGTKATIRLEMNKVDDFTVSTGEGYADSKITLTMTNEKTGSTFSTVLNTVSNTKGGHYDSSSSVPAFIVENTVVSGDTYTVEISGSGYVTYKKAGISFDGDTPLALDNADFIPGDVNMDGKVDAADKTAYEEVKSGNYTNYAVDLADFNRDGKVDGYDDVFAGITVPDTGEEDNKEPGKEPEKEPEKKTVPAKMEKPTLEGGEKKITVSWKVPANGGSPITGYTIQYGTSKNRLNKKVEVTNAAATSETITDLNASTKYYMQIAAKNAIGTGEFSAIENAETNKATSSGGGGSGGGGGSSGGGGGGGGYSSGGSAAGGFSSGGTTGTGSTEGSTVTSPATNNSAEIFVDMGNHVWAKEAVYTLREKGVINGVSETEFAPANHIKRGDFILILVRMLGIDTAFTENFIDVPQDSYYYEAIGKAKAVGIATGDGINFMPENSITRQDLITLAYRAFLNMGYIAEAADTAPLDVFGDKDSISAYARSAMASMVSAGIIQGADGNVNPLGNATRAEVAVMCARMLALMN